MPTPTYTCKVCGQEFWLDPADMLQILPDHLDSSACRRARRRSLIRSVLRTAWRQVHAMCRGRPRERIEYTIRVPMELVTVSAPGPIDLLAPAYEQQLTGTGGGFVAPPLRWRRASFASLCAIVEEQLAVARRKGLVPAEPVRPADLRRWGHCRVVYPDSPGGAQRAQGLEELTVMMTRP